jgi:outer membrane protein OmpA-like peptidoglycan-associated protein
MKNLFITIILLIGININVFPQEKSDKEIIGDSFFNCYSFDKAIKFYTHTKQLSLAGQRRLAESYHNIDLNVESETVYSNLIKAQGDLIQGDNSDIKQNKQSGAEYSGTVTAPGELTPEDYYNYAMVLKSNGKYEEAGKMMDIFNELKPDDLRAKEYSINKNELANLSKDNGKYKIEHLNVNTDALDFGTSYYKDKIVFSSSRVTKYLRAKLFRWTRKPFWDMYISDVDSGQLINPENFDKSLNGKMNDGPASFSNDGTFIAFTRNNYNQKTRNRIVQLQIQFSSYNDGKWSEPVPFVYNSNSYSVGQPCLTNDGKIMYFTSDMPGGYGKADIYRVEKNEKGEWGKPENLGNKINTEGDEMFPFLEERNKILYFASDGRFGLGGLDIYSSTLSGSGFGNVYNAGFPLNTQYNDYAIIVNDSVSNGYFSSDRPGGSGGDDIYSVAFKANVAFSVISPMNIPVERRVRETFPLRNYVFFNLGSTEISDRYVLLTKDQVKDFKEDQLEVFTPKELSGRSKRQLTVYYNVLNILGDRLGKNPTATINLTGSSMQGQDDGLAMAESVKRYLVNVFGIDSSRLITEGRIKPRIPSEQPGGILELDLLREGDRRVSIGSTSPEMLMEFQSGPDAPLKPVEFITVQEAPLDSYVSFRVDGAQEALSSWSLELMDENGAVQNFGPYTQENVSIPGKSILGTRPEGNYKAIMTGLTKYGNKVIKEAPVHMVLWTPPINEEMMRFSIIFEFNDSQAISIYEKYLSEIVTPKIPIDGTVIIHGHTDIIGDEAHNSELSVARADEVRSIIENTLHAKAGRTDVKFEVYGFGEDLDFSPFENKYPEERFYNRTVIIDIIPPKQK